MPRQFPPSKTEVRASESADPAELAGLAAHRSSFVRSAVARNPHTSAETITLLVASDDKYVRSAAARNRNAPVEALSTFAESEDQFTLEALAKNRATPPEILTRLATSEHPTVRAAVAKNRATPVETLRLLTGDSHYTVLCNLAWHSGTPDDALIRLVQSGHAPVIHKLSSRKSYLNSESRNVLATRFNGRASVSQNIRIPIERGGRFSSEVIEAFAASRHHTLHRTAASQPDAPVEVLRAMAGHEDQWVRVRVAQNPAAPDDVLVRLVQEGPSDVVIAMSERPGLSDAVMESVALSRSGHAHERLCSQSGMMARLMASATPKVRAVAAKYGHTLLVDPWQSFLADPDEAVRDMAAQSMPLLTLEVQVSHSCKKVRQVLAERSRFPETLAKLASDEAVVVRRRVAANQFADGPTLALLAGDSDARTQRAASERFLAALSRLT